MVKIIRYLLTLVTPKSPCALVYRLCKPSIVVVTLVPVWFIGRPKTKIIPYPEHKSEGYYFLHVPIRKQINTLSPSSFSTCIHVVLLLLRSLPPRIYPEETQGKLELR